MVQAAPTFEAQLAALRTWINESLARIYLAKMEDLDAGPSLTQLAEIALDLCAQVNLKEIDLEGTPESTKGPLPFTILAMGRFGVGAMAPASDLDLIFLVDPGSVLENATRTVSRYISTLNARLQEGRVYEIDTRLRPSGASGPPTLTFSSFADHQLRRAKTWEHLALTFMRPIVGSDHGNADLAQQVSDLKTQILNQPRDPDQWRADCQMMLRRLLAQRIDQPGQSPAEVKLSKGGLMELEYILAADRLHEQRLHLTKALTTQLPIQRQALTAHRLWGQIWVDKHPGLAKDFFKSQDKVRAATIDLLGHPETYPTGQEHEETAVRWQST